MGKINLFPIQSESFSDNGSEMAWEQMFKKETIWSIWFHFWPFWATAKSVQICLVEKCAICPC